MIREVTTASVNVIDESAGAITAHHVDDASAV